MTNRTLGQSVVVATPREAGPTVGGEGGRLRGESGTPVPPGAGGAWPHLCPRPYGRNRDAQPGSPRGPAMGRLPGLSPAWVGDQAVPSQRPVSAREAAWITLVSCFCLNVRTRLASERTRNATIHASAPESPSDSRLPA